jgi:hypothetical protein
MLPHYSLLRNEFYQDLLGQTTAAHLQWVDGIWHVCSGTGTSTDRKGYLSSSVTSGGASLTCDNGFNAGVEVKPVKSIDLEADYSRSVPLRLNTFSFGISLRATTALETRRRSLNCVEPDWISVTVYSLGVSLA